jgi:enoyl-CoA hydratase/carnithine racemase
MLDANAMWDVPARGETVEVPPDKEKLIAEEIQGAYFAIVCDVLDAGIITPSDYDLLISTALDMKPPFTFMNSLDVDRSLDLVEAFAKKYPQMPVSRKLKAQAASGKPWEILDVLFDKKGDIGVITIRRPNASNALNRKVIAEIENYLQIIRNDPDIKAGVLTGFGNKIFVAGRDIRELASLADAADSEKMAVEGQFFSLKLERLGKPLVAAMNGLALGGGCELSLTCTARVAPKGLKFFAGQPEANLGISPALGATQRLPRLIGFERAAEMIRTAKPISSAQALEYGLINEEVEGDVLERAMELAREIASGKTKVKIIEKGPLPNVPDSLPSVDIGHLSRVIDNLSVRSMLEGARMSLEDGLMHEAKLHSECWNTEDYRIGFKNFMENGTRSRAVFVHR